MNILVLQAGRGTINIEQRTMLLKLAALLLKSGGHLAFSDDTTSGMLGHARAVLLRRLASSSCERALWLDTDTTLSPERILEMAARPEDVIMWNYPVRVPFDVDYPPERARELARSLKCQVLRMWTGTPKMGASAVLRSEDGELVEMHQGGFGAVLMSPRAAAHMVETYGTTKDWSKNEIALAFDPPPQPFGRSSEDITFWRRYTAAGGRIWCDPKPYVTNGQSGGCYADEIAKTDRLFVGMVTGFYGAG